VARVVWSVREDQVGKFDAPELASGYRSAHPVYESKIGDVLQLLVGARPWRAARLEADEPLRLIGGVLAVERESGAPSPAWRAFCG
jgi:hypothetical protein